MLILNYVPISFKKLFQIFDVNLGLRSDTIDTRTPCNYTISATHNFASFSRDDPSEIAKKCATLVNLLTIPISHCYLLDFWVIPSQNTSLHALISIQELQ